MRSLGLFGRIMIGFAVIFVAWSPPVRAFSDGSLYGGLACFMESSLGKQTRTSDGEPSLLGTPNYPLMLKYDWKVFTETYLSPTFFYTVFDRKSAGNSTAVNVWHLMLPVGQNFGRNRWDWSAGLGLLNRTIKGKGGFVTLNNGTGSTVFALPGRKVSSRVLTLNGGVAFNHKASRFGLDLTIEGVASDKRTYDLMFSYTYAFYQPFGSYY